MVNVVGQSSLVRDSLTEIIAVNVCSGIKTARLWRFKKSYACAYAQRNHLCPELHSAESRHAVNIRAADWQISRCGRLGRLDMIDRNHRINGGLGGEGLCG